MSWRQYQLIQAFRLGRDCEPFHGDPIQYVNDIIARKCGKMRLGADRSNNVYRADMYVRQLFKLARMPRIEFDAKNAYPMRARRKRDEPQKCVRR
jgi:hypothetical protein